MSGFNSGKAQPADSGRTSKERALSASSFIRFDLILSLSAFIMIADPVLTDLLIWTLYFMKGSLPEAVRREPL